VNIGQRSSWVSAATGRDRFLVRVDMRAARIVSTLLLLSAFGCLAVLLVRESVGSERIAPGRFGWSLALLAAVALITRGIFLGRRVTAAHAAVAVAWCVSASVRTFCRSAFSATSLPAAAG
jgi:hypothetical protein